MHVSTCVLVRVCGWAPCQPLSDSTPSRWRIFVSETNGTERINYRHNVGDMPELQGGGGENKPFPCTLRFHPSSFLLIVLPCQPMAGWGRWHVPSLPVIRPLCGAPQGDGTHSRHSPEATVAPRHQRRPRSHRREKEKDTLRLGNIVPIHHSVWQYFTICNLALKRCSSNLQWVGVSEQVMIIPTVHCC